MHYIQIGSLYTIDRTTHFLPSITFATMPTNTSDAGKIAKKTRRLVCMVIRRKLLINSYNNLINLSRSRVNNFFYATRSDVAYSQ